MVIKTPLTGKLPTHAHTYAQKPIGSVRICECILCLVSCIWYLVSCICAWKYFHNKQQAFVRCRCTGKRHSVVIVVQPQEMLLLSACSCAQRGLTGGERRGSKRRGDWLRLAAVLTATLSVLKMKINRHMQHEQQPKRVCKGCRRGTLTTHNLHASVAFAVETSFFWQPSLSPSPSLSLSHSHMMPAPEICREFCYSTFPNEFYATEQWNVVGPTAWNIVTKKLKTFQLSLGHCVCLCALPALISFHMHHIRRLSLPQPKHAVAAPLCLILAWEYEFSFSPAWLKMWVAPQTLMRIT